MVTFFAQSSHYWSNETHSKRPSAMSGKEGGIEEFIRFQIFNPSLHLSPVTDNHLSVLAILFQLHVFVKYAVISHLIPLYYRVRFAGIGRFEHIGLGFLKFSLILCNSDGKIREKVV